MTISSKELRLRVARNVRTLRKVQGLTQESFAHRIGIATRHLQKVEKAEVNLTLNTIAKIASAAGIDPAQLLL